MHPLGKLEGLSCSYPQSTNGSEQFVRRGSTANPIEHLAALVHRGQKKERKNRKEKNNMPTDTQALSKTGAKSAARRRLGLGVSSEV